MLCTLFRLNTGRAWISGFGPKGVQRLTDGSVLIKAARPVALGFSLTNGDPLNGASDLNGWTEVEITPEMVGRRIAVFTAIECKASSGGRTSAEQHNYIGQVQRAGGIAGVAASPEQAKQIIEEYKAKLKQAKLL